MPHSDTIPVSASIASTGKGIRYVGNHVWANSGLVSVTNVAGTLLSFSTAPSYILAEIMFFYDSVAQADNIKYIIYLNNQIVYSIQLNQATTDPGAQTPLTILLPPTTTVKMTAYNLTDTDSQDVGATLTGRVYGAA